jgi:hypothetical protein
MGAGEGHLKARGGLPARVSTIPVGHLVSAMDYTPEQERAILAAASGNKDPVWNQMPWIIDQLSQLGIVKTQRVERANGAVDTYPLGLSTFGIQEARRLGGFE